MKRRAMCVAIIVALALLAGVGCAEGIISTTVVMRVSHMTQDAVVNAGEDLSMEVNVEGVAPAAYQWYFNDQAIVGANQRVYNIVDASLEDAGVYRLDAFDAEGTMLLSMEISARVIDGTVPKAGDASLPVGVALAGAAAGLAALGAKLFVRRRTA